MLTPDEAYIINFNSGIDMMRGPPDRQDRHYAGQYLHLYAAEDELDQPLCILGRKHNIDIIILENMVGSHLIITEILDTRDRMDSFSSLLYIVD